MMQYRLLRNNKESGPYTKAQLEEIGLKPYDLLWIEGRGGAWLYASEINDLKDIAPAVEEQPYDRFYKGKEKQAAGSTGSNQHTATVATSTAPPLVSNVRQSKPRFRISGDKVVMIDNTTLQQPKPLEDALSAFAKREVATAAAAPAPTKPAARQEASTRVQQAGMDWEDMYANWKVEEKENEVKAAPAKVQTMEEVRQRFEESKLMHAGTKTNSTAGGAKQNIMAAIAVAVLAIGGYAGYKMNEGDAGGNRTTQATPVVEKAEIMQNANGEDGGVFDTDETTVAAQSTTAISSPAGESVNIQPAPVEAKKSNPIEPPATAAPAANVAAANANETAEKKRETTAGTSEKNSEVAAANETIAKPQKHVEEEKTPVITRTSSAEGTTHAPVSEPVAVKHPVPPAKKINDYITVGKLGNNSNSGSVQNVLLSVKNVSDFPIDLAVIDIQYFGENGKMQKGETMYVKNIGAGSNVNVRIPDSKTSRSVQYKVSLVSSEQKTLYLVGE